ncbi:MAG: hypothetical protein ACYTJ0_21440, partial [Planctomycetota bacterium]
RSYRYAPYEHPPYRVTDESLARLEAAGLAEAALQRLADLGGRTLTSRSELESALADVLPDREQRMLAYLAAMAWSRPVGPGLCRRLWPDTIHRIGIARDKVSDTLKRLRRSLRGRASGCAERPWDEFHEQYEAIVDLPREQRLEAIARVVATAYCGGDDAAPFLAKLRELPASLTDRLVEERSPGLLLAALPAAIAGETILGDVDPDEAERTAEQYALLMTEFAATARDLGARLTVVLIPVAGYGDAGYRRFWSPLIDTAARYRQRRAIHEATRRRLEGVVPVIDLLDHADRLEDGYWKFDGHWNERGNDAVADVLL